MSAPGLTLKEIHRLRKHVKDLDGKLEQGPKAHRAHQLKVAQAEEALAKAQDGIKHLKVTIHEKETSIKGAQLNIEKLDKTPISNKKEYDALRVEIATIKDSIRKLEDQILDAMSELEDKNKRIPEAEKALAKAKSDAAQFDKEHQDRLNLWAQERQKALGELATIEATLEETIKVQYDRLVVVKGDECLSGVANRICTSCYTEVTSQMANELQRGLFVVCKNCGRMLYQGD